MHMLQRWENRTPRWQFRSAAAAAGGALLAGTVPSRIYASEPSGRGSTAPSDSWKRNLLFQPPSGFWSDDAWYDLQLERRLPLAAAVLRQLVWALPPLSTGRVADIGAGTGRSALAIAAAYPQAEITLLDADAGRGAIAISRLEQQRQRQQPPQQQQQPAARFIDCAVAADGSAVPGGPYDCVVAVQAVRHIVAPPPHYAAKLGLPVVSDEAEILEGYRKMLRGLYASVVPGGHVFIADHVVHRHPGVFAHGQLLAEVGFVDVDVAWREQDWFVVGARRPLV